MGVEGTAEPSAVIAAVEAAGYGASEKGAAQSSPRADEQQLEDHETPRIRRRLLWSVGFLLVLMYFSMGHMMWGWPLPHFYDDNHVAMGLTQLLLTGIIMVINQKFFISGYKALWHRAPNMDTLVALGATAAFGYSTYALFAMTAAQVRGDEAAVMTYMMDFYFESAAGGPVQGQDHRRPEKPHEPGPQNRLRAPGRPGGGGAGGAGAAGGRVRRPARGEHPCGRRGAGGLQRRQ